MEAPGSEEDTLRTAVDGAVRGRRIEEVSIERLLRAFDRPRIAWSTATTTVVAGGAAARVTAEGPARFASVRNDAEAVFAGLDSQDDLPTVARPRLYGGFAFHEGHVDPGPDDPWQGFPGALFVLPAIQLALDGDDRWLTAAATGPEAADRADRRLRAWTGRLDALPGGSGGQPAITARRPTPDEAGWRDQVLAATDSVGRGDLRKVVLAQSLAVDLDGPIDAVGLLDELGGTYPGCTRFLVEPAGGTVGTFLGATPEQLVTRDGRTVSTEALAGSIGRGETRAEDEWLATRLRESEKDVHEHELVVEAIRDQLAPLAASVHAGTRTVRKLATVQHLRTPIRATLDRDEHVLGLVEALHPTPAVGGLPPDDALRTIRETEAFDRGWYAAPVGWFDASGDGAFAVAIRSVLGRDRRARLFAGAGLVADSDPDAEYDELKLKYRPILDELG